MTNVGLAIFASSSQAPFQLVASQLYPMSAFMLQQRLTDVNHPDHTLITYPGLGHDLSPAIGESTGSAMYGLQKVGPIEDYVLADLYAWLEAHSGISHSVATTTASPVGANTSSLNTSTTSPSNR
jgi:uncharacterized protein